MTTHHFRRLFFKVLMLSALGFAHTAQAVSFNLNTSADLSTMLVNLSQEIPSLMRLVTAFAYVAGVCLIFKGLLELKHVGEMRSMMSHEHGFMKPLMYLLVGTLLLYLPGSVRTGLSTFWSNPMPYAYVSEATDSWTDLTNAIFMVVQLIGTIAFIRGLLMLTHVSGHGGQPGTFSKAIAFIISGILCINLYQFIEAVINTLGLGTLSPT